MEEERRTRVRWAGVGGAAVCLAGVVGWASSTALRGENVFVSLTSLASARDASTLYAEENNSAAVSAWTHNAHSSQRRTLAAPRVLESAFQEVKETSVVSCGAALESAFWAGTEASWSSFASWRASYGEPGDAVRICASATGSWECSPGERLSEIGVGFSAFEWLSVAADAEAVACEALRIAPANATKGILVAIHGGGFVAFSAASYFAPRFVSSAKRLEAAAYLVEYDLSPRSDGATMLEQCWAVLRAAIAQHPPGTPVALFGDSAGGALTASLAILAKARGVSVALQVLVSPMLAAADWHRFSSYCNLSSHAFATSTVVTSPGLAYCWGARVGAGAARTMRADYTISPFDATDAQLEGVAPALVIASSDDVLHDEAQQYARRLQQLETTDARFVDFADLQHDPILRSRPIWEAAIAAAFAGADPLDATPKDER